MTLRDHLLDALHSLPGKRTLHLHLLLSSPRKHGSLFPYATATLSREGQRRRPPRVYAQDILIFVSEETKQDRILVFALESTVYTIPTTRSMVVSIVKVDSTGHGMRPAPTSTVIRAFISYFADPATRPRGWPIDRVWVHLFARAQGQYLFPGSSEWAGKQVLSGERLCKWWKRVLTGVASSTTTTECKPAPSLWWLLPGLSEAEALQAVGELSGSNSSGSGAWIYGHPYAQTEIPLPYAPFEQAATPYNLAHFIPSFDDDPKTRFLDEIACTTQADGVLSPKRKRVKTAGGTAAAASTVSSSQEKDKESTEREEKPHGELGKVSPDEFWERMSFRQECISGAATGFFVAVFPWPSPADGSSRNPLAPQAGEVSFQMNRRIIVSMQNTDFSTEEGAVSGTAMLENAIRGMCEGAPVAEVPPPTMNTRLDKSELPPPKNERRTPSPGPGGARTLVVAAPIEDDVSPNPFPEPTPSSDTYRSFIYGTVSVDNPLPTPSAAPVAAKVVTQLAVRKKVKKT